MKRSPAVQQPLQTPSSRAILAWEEAAWGWDGFKGLKESYEDRVGSEHLEALGRGWGLFDGHGGSRAAEHVAAELWQAMARQAAGRVGDVDQALERRRADFVLADRAKRRTRLEPRTRAELERIEAAAREVDDVLSEIQALSYGAPEGLASVRRDLELRRAWLDDAARKRGSRRASDALSSVQAAEREALEARNRQAARIGVVLADDDWKRVVVDAYREVDGSFLNLAERKHWNDGTCALCALLVDDDMAPTGAKLVVANAGDSRAILLRGNGAVRASVEHKPSTAAERKRIERAGGYVVEVNGVARCTSSAGAGFAVDRGSSLYLAVSRALGDRQLKKPSLLVPDPDVRIFKLLADDALLVLASDGVTDALDDSAIVDLAVTEPDPTDAAKLIIREAFTKGAADNVTVLVLRFPWTNHAELARSWRPRAERRAPSSFDLQQPTAIAPEPTLDMFA